MKNLLKENPLTYDSIWNKLSHHREDKIKKVMRWLSDNDHLLEEDGKYFYRE